MKKNKPLTSKDYFKLAHENLENHPLTACRFLRKAIEIKRKEGFEKILKEGSHE